MSRAKSGRGRLLAAYLAGSHICQLELVLIDAPAEAAVKLFHPTAECTLERKAAAETVTHSVPRCGKVSRDALETQVPESGEELAVKRLVVLGSTNRKRGGRHRTHGSSDET